MTNLKSTFLELIAKYTSGQQLPGKFWQEIEEHYTAAGRCYHILAHLESMLKELEQVKPAIRDWDTVLFALYYHDLIYEPVHPGNEERSAAMAVTRLSDTFFPKDKVEKCRDMILATRTHLASADSDTNYFTDADLCILGAGREAYRTYANEIRKEYSAYPDSIYNEGRKKVLAHFLNMERIYKTGFFFDKFETKARQNLRDEFNSL